MLVQSEKDELTITKYWIEDDDDPEERSYALFKAESYR